MLVNEIIEIPLLDLKHNYESQGPGDGLVEIIEIPLLDLKLDQKRGCLVRVEC